MKVRSLLLGAVLLLAACASNPFSSAKTIEQKAFASYGTFVVAEEVGARVMGDTGVPASVKRAIQRADAKAKPTADQLKKTLDEYISIRDDLKASPDKKKAAAANLAKWYTDAKPVVDCLLKVATGGDTSCSN
jgi:hypothetical protein